MKPTKQLSHLLHLTLIGVVALLAWWILTGNGLTDTVHAQEDENCIAYTIVGYEDTQQRFHTIAIEPGNCVGTSPQPLLTELPGWKR